MSKSDESELSRVNLSDLPEEIVKKLKSQTDRVSRNFLMKIVQKFTIYLIFLPLQKPKDAKELAKLMKILVLESLKMI